MRWPHMSPPWLNKVELRSSREVGISLAISWESMRICLRGHSPSHHLIPLVMFFPGSKGQQLAFEIDSNQPASRDIAILCHGMFCSRKTTLVTHLSEAVKINTFRFDFSGNGDSRGEFTLAGFEREAAELKDAVVYCQSQGYRVVAIIGHSKAAQVVLVYSALYGDVPIVVSLAPRFDMTGENSILIPYLDEIDQKGFAMVTHHKKEYRVTREMVAERRAVNMESYAQRVQNWVLLLHCEDDEVIPVANAYLFQVHLGERLMKLQLLPAGSHFFTGEAEQQVVEAINEFLSQMVPIFNLRGTV